MPCVASPCSPSDSPWSAVSTTSVRPRAARCEERLQQRAERGVGGRDLAVVGRAGEARGERLGRRVGAVRLVEVHPAERRAPGGPRRSRPCARATVAGAAALLLEQRRPRLRVDEAVVVDVEAAREAEARVEREGAHEGAGAVAARLQQRGQRVGPGREAEAGVVAHAVVEREAAREDVRVGRQRHDVVRVRVVEAHAGARPGGRSTAWRRRRLP